MKLLSMWIASLGLLVAGVFPVLGTESTVNWETLKLLNYETGTMADKIKKHVNTTVRVAGFIVPTDLSGEFETVKEFLLVPNPLACIHVPPPPPNQMVFVTMNKAIPLDMDERGVEIEGVLKVAKSLFLQEMPDTESDKEMYLYSFEMNGVSAKKANIPYEDPFMKILREGTAH